MTNSPDPIPTRRRSVPHRQYRSAALLCVLVLFGAVGCVHDPTVGPLYDDAPSPNAGSARVYLYRIDPHHSYSTVELRFDDEAPLQILDEEYITVELEEGTHEIAFRLRRRFLWPSGAWRAQRIRARDGETIYFEIAVGVTERPPPTSRTLQIPGRAEGTAGEAVSVRMISESEAHDLIRMTHLHVP